MKKYSRSTLALIAGSIATLSALASADGARAQPSPSSSIRVEASRETWTDSGIDLASRETLSVAGAGMAGWEPGVTSGPDGVPGTACALAVPGAPIGALVARVGSGTPAVVRAGVTLNGPGRVALLYNDCPGQYFDNNGGFEAMLTVQAPPAPVVTAAPVALPEPVIEPVVEPAVEREAGRSSPLLPAVLVLALLGVVGAAGYRFRRLVWRGRVYAFDDSARLESSAWMFPKRLRELQGERRKRRSLSIGGPDADIDFGLAGEWARLYPTEDGGARLETDRGGAQVMVDGSPVVFGQRLQSGQRVFVERREFVFYAGDEAGALDPSMRYRRADPPASPDPRAA